MSPAGFAGSEWPNVIMIAAVAASWILAAILRVRTQWWFAAATVAAAAAIAVKNFGYQQVITNPHAENSFAARHDFANILLSVAVLEFVVAAVLIGSLLLASTRHIADSQRRRLKSLAWLWVATGLAAVNAAVSMLDWRRVYLATAANQPVRYQMVAPAWLHWTLLVLMAAAVVIGIVQLERGRRASAAS